jgi:hypothetical protein
MGRFFIVSISYTLPEQNPQEIFIYSENISVHRASYMLLSTVRQLSQVKEYMRKILIALTFIPLAASAQSEPNALDWAIANSGFATPAPAYGLPVQPVLPVPQDKGPWGTGYSIVTTTRPQRNLWDRDLTGSETVQRVVPNDGLGQPMRGLDLGWGR